MDNEKLIIVGSTNQSKVASIRKALIDLNLLNYYTIRPHDAPSGVSEQPTSRAEIVLGAKNRAASCKEKYPDAEIWIGIEGGVYLDEVINAHFNIAYVYAEMKNGKSGISPSSQFMVDEKIISLMKSETITLSQAIERIHNVPDIGKGTGASGMYSRGTVPRNVYNLQPALFALSSCL